MRQVEIDYNNCPFVVTENDFTKEPKAWLRGRAEVHICDFGGGRLAMLSGYDGDGRLAMIPGPDEIREAIEKDMVFERVGTRYVAVKKDSGKAAPRSSPARRRRKS